MAVIISQIIVLEDMLPIMKQDAVIQSIEFVPLNQKGFKVCLIWNNR
ncbi:hypothetical protein [Cytobacillus purgationiresistens]|uniref:Uncharacterized protein n=1 Tax=Cytobacillus purgationiresistens TaxID=863449 RepID=A0ABU0AGJ2_9BACI|nr:hypothetical protein [Cytobacillus purgationiresistens]MDQ0270373.1 hypothetical protein [Cytobacillus purgationiresistens]